MAKKITPASTTYSVSAKLSIDVSMDITASSLEDAALKTKELTVNDFVDFSSLGLQHNDSEKPDVYSIYRM